MPTFEFLVRRGDCVIHSAKLILPDLSAAWDRVSDLAETYDEPGTRIVVRNEAGAIEISVGVNTARRVLAETASAA